MIFFEAGFNGAFAANASSNVENNTQDNHAKPICGGMHFPNKVLNAPGCVGGNRSSSSSRSPSNVPNNAPLLLEV